MRNEFQSLQIVVQNMFQTLSGWADLFAWLDLPDSIQVEVSTKLEMYTLSGAGSSKISHMAHLESEFCLPLKKSDQLKNRALK